MTARTRPPVSQVEQRTGDIDTACARYGLGKMSMRRVAEDAGAVIRVGRRYLINLPRVDKYMDALCEGRGVRE